MIGYGVQISAAQSIIIEDDVAMGAGAVIVDHIHDHRYPGIPIIDSPLSTPEPVRIGKHSFLGVYCLIGPGVQIGEHAVIAANAVVLKDVPAYCIAAGNPHASFASTIPTRPNQMKNSPRLPLPEIETLIEPEVVPSVAAAAASRLRLFSNGAAMAVANLAGRGLGYISIILMARKISTSYIGVYALLYTTGMLVELVANLGLDKLLMREIAGGSHSAGKGFFWAALPIRLVMAALSAGVAWILLGVFYQHQLLVTPLVVAVFLSVIFPVIATRNCESFLTAHERLVPIAISQLGERVVMFAAVILLITNHLSFGGMLCIAPIAATVRLGIVAFSTRRI